MSITESGYQEHCYNLVKNVSGIYRQNTIILWGISPHEYLKTIIIPTATPKAEISSMHPTRAYYNCNGRKAYAIDLSHDTVMLVFFPVDSWIQW